MQNLVGSKRASIVGQGSFLTRQRNQLRFKRLANLLLLNGFSGLTSLPARTPHKIFINSIPKSGTNLLMKTLHLFPTIKNSHISLHSEMTGTLWRPTQPLRRQIWNIFPSVRSSYELAKTAKVNVSEQQAENYVTIGGFHNVFVPGEELEKLFSHVRSGWFAAGHIPFSNRFERLLIDNNFKMILIIRDPRDVINSELNFFLNTKRLLFHDYYQPLSREKGLMSIIRGVPQYGEYPKQPNIRELLLDYIPWLSKPYVYLTTFEDLVGPQGKGDNNAQTEQILAIARHLDVSISDEELAYVKTNAFGGTHTFRKGAIGSWRKLFSEEHKLACKELIGDLLIQLGYEVDTNWF
jgi:sulfotransferase 6B1